MINVRSLAFDLFINKYTFIKKQLKIYYAQKIERVNKYFNLNAKQ